MIQSLDLPLVTHLRAGADEMIHQGSVVIACSGTTAGVIGDPDSMVALRSCGKPFQIAALLESGLSHYQLDDSALSFMGSSHNGEEAHVAQLRRLLALVNLDITALTCGTHEPYRSWVVKSVETNNCTGKHAAMLLTSRALGWPIQGYAEPQHPVQEVIRMSLSGLFGHLEQGIDGCGVPTYGVPLQKVAQAYSHLASGTTEALRQMARAYMADPFMLGGTDRIESHLNRRYQIAAKPGSDGLWAAAVPKLGLGFAIKIRSGNENAASLVALTLLEHLGVLTIKHDPEVRRLLEWDLKTGTGAMAGRIEVVSLGALLA